MFDTYAIARNLTAADFTPAHWTPSARRPNRTYSRPEASARRESLNVASTSYSSMSSSGVQMTGGLQPALRHARSFLAGPDSPQVVLRRPARRARRAARIPVGAKVRAAALGRPPVVA